MKLWSLKKKNSLHNKKLHLSKLSINEVNCLLEKRPNSAASSDSTRPLLEFGFPLLLRPPNYPYSKKI